MSGDSPQQPGPQKRSFTIRRMEPGEQIPNRKRPPAPAASPNAGPPPAATPETTSRSPSTKARSPKRRKAETPQAGLTGGLFADASSLLACLGSVVGTGLTDAASLHRSPEGQWWSAVRVDAHSAAPLIVGTGGRAFALCGSSWSRVDGGGDLQDEPPGGQNFQPNDWPTQTLEQLLAACPLRRCPLRAAQEVFVVLPAALGRWLLRRALSEQLQVEITRGRLARLDTEQPPTANGVLQLRLTSVDRPIARTLLDSLARLPGVVIGELTESGTGRLLLDLGHALPFNPNLLAELIPEGDTWVLGPPDIGHFHLTLEGDSVNGADLASTSSQALPLPDVLPGAEPAPKVPEGPAVRLVSVPGLPGRVDAVLLDDSDLNRVRIWMTGRPFGEELFLFPGAGRHLLTCPGGLSGVNVPFGVPLTRMGPGGLYVELGCTFSPMLPAGARQQRFGLPADSSDAVAVTQEGAWRFLESHLTPAWSLYVGEPPEVQSGVSARGQVILKAISDAWRRAELERQRRLKAQLERDRTKEPGRRIAPESKRPALLEEAQRLEHSGHLVAAAQKLEEAGLPGPAGRLYERAARGLG